jgi:hypothetical protein
MGIFTRRKTKEAADAAAKAPVAMPNLDLEKAASVIESHQRGKIARARTNGLKAHREVPGGPFDALTKCLPCLQPPAASK